MRLRRNSTPLFLSNPVHNFNLKKTLHENNVANSISNDIVIGGLFQIEWLMWLNVPKIVLKPRRNSVFLVYFYRITYLIQMSM